MQQHQRTGDREIRPVFWTLEPIVTAGPLHLKDMDTGCAFSFEDSMLQIAGIQFSPISACVYVLKSSGNVFHSVSFSLICLQK